MKIEADTYVRTAPFWDGAENGQLVLQYCNDSGRFQHPPRPVSIYTGRRNLSWRAVAGTGVVYATTVLHAPKTLASCIATVQLDEGVQIVARVLGAETVAIGTRVKLEMDTLAGGQFYPAFRVE